MSSRLDSSEERVPNSRAVAWWGAAVGVFLVHHVFTHPGEAPDVGLAGGLEVDVARPCGEVAVYLYAHLGRLAPIQSKSTAQY